MILAAVTVAITLAVSVIIVLNVLGAVDVTDADNTIAANLGHNASHMNPGANATTDLQTNIETFYTVAPIVLIVMAAVGILAYVLLLRRK
jgi:hypothetical protein